MSEWPPLAEPELQRRLAADDDEFGALTRAVWEQLPPRAHDAETLARALAYPWARPVGSYLLSGGQVEPLAAMAAARRDEVLARFTGPGSGRVALLAIGSNAAPVATERKFAHFAKPEERSLLALVGHLHDFDIGVAPHPALYGSLPATPFPSPGTAVRAALLWVTPAQFTQLTWSELSYRLGRLRTRFEVEESEASFDAVLVFASRFGTFCPDGEPVALAAVPARSRTAPERSQEQLLDAAAALAFGAGATAATMVRALHEEPAATLATIAARVHPAGLPFESERWTPYPTQPPGTPRRTQ